MTTNIDTGDTVLHRPSNERWVVAYVEGDRLAWCGWPDGTADLSDCVLLRKTSPEQRLALLHEMARSVNDGPRRTHARKALGMEPC